MLTVTLLLMALGGGAQQTPLPTIQNGRVETRQATSLDNEVAAAKRASIDPVWVAWRVPVADGQRGRCSTEISNEYYYRGDFLEGRVTNVVPPTPPAGPVSIEAGSSLV